jgi:hypothetical protein
MAFLLVVFALLLSATRRSELPGGGGGSDASDLLNISGVQKIFVDYAVSDDWIEYLRQHRSDGLGTRIHFRPLHRAPTNSEGVIVYEVGTGAIQLRALPDAPDGSPRVLVQIWHPPGHREAIAPFEDWFWRTSERYFHKRAVERLGPDIPAPPGSEGGSPWAAAHRIYREQLLSLSPALNHDVFELSLRYSDLQGESLAARSLIASALVMFAIFFASVYLLPSLTCEERERGILLAQALSPASPWEILAAKFLVHAGLALILATAVAAAYSPGAISRWYFWASVLILTAGSLGIGITIACIARTQRAASMGALCYMLMVALLIMICEHIGVKWLPVLTLEFHAPRLLHTALGDKPPAWNPDLIQLALTTPLALTWVIVAFVIFRRRGWQ